jgi:hypothetical protein
MKPPLAGFEGGPALVPGELRGYRHFRLRDDGLHPVSCDQFGPWSRGVYRAACAVDDRHDPPDPECACGLYGWYRPDSEAAPLLAVPAVIAARGRTVLGDRGFRAAAARIEAVALPRQAYPTPGSLRRARAALAAHHPEVTVYRSARRMQREHPGADLRALGITPRPPVTRQYVRVAAVLWAVLVVASYTTLLAPDRARTVWLGSVLGVMVAHWVLIVVVVAQLRDRPDD